MEKLILNKCFTVAIIITFVLGVFLPTIGYAESYAVLFSGGEDMLSNYDCYYEETLRMWQITTSTLGYDASNVYVLFADGTDAAVDRSSGVSSDWSMITAAGGHIMAGTAANLQSTFADLSGIMGADDCFDFWSFDHGGNSYYYDPGGPIQDAGYLVGWGEDNFIRDDEFADWVDPFNVKAEAYAFAQCFAGDMADDLFELDGSEHRFAAWAAAWNEVSYGEGWADAWADGLEAGLKSTWELGQYAMDHDPYGFGTGGTGQETPGWIGANFDIITNEPIPEPSTVLLLGTGVIGVFALRRRKR